MGNVVKRRRVLNRGAFFAKERYLFFFVFFFALGLLFLLGETGPTLIKLCPRSLGKRGRRGGNEISLPPPKRAHKEFFLARKESAFKSRNYKRVAHRAMREHYIECRVFAGDIRPRFGSARVRDLMTRLASHFVTVLGKRNGSSDARFRVNAPSRDGGCNRK